jgi:hypothetical protein
MTFERVINNIGVEVPNIFTNTPTIMESFH